LLCARNFIFCFQLQNLDLPWKYLFLIRQKDSFLHILEFISSISTDEILHEHPTLEPLFILFFSYLSLEQHHHSIINPSTDDHLPLQFVLFYQKAYFTSSIYFFSKSKGNSLLLSLESINGLLCSDKRNPQLVQNALLFRTDHDEIPKHFSEKIQN
jgi:hypothetical protein